MFRYWGGQTAWPPGDEMMSFFPQNKSVAHKVVTKFKTRFICAAPLQDNVEQAVNNVRRTG